MRNGGFDEAIRLNPNNAQSYNIRGNVWDGLGVFERALADHEAIRIDTSPPYSMIVQSCGSTKGHLITHLST